MKRAIKIKGKPLSAWKAWIRNELKPPVAPALDNPVIQYVLEGFLELIEQVQR